MEKHWFLKWLEGFGVSPGGFLAVFFLVVLLLLSTLIHGFFLNLLTWIFALAPIWLPIALGISLWKLWIAYVQAAYIAEQDVILLEIRIPREISKSPRAMELVLSGLHIGPGETTFIHRQWMGRVRPWWSLELVSKGGEIRFYVWTRKFFKEFVEHQFYAQYPEIEIYEVEDYAATFVFDSDKYNLWGCDFKLSEDDPLPIKTYVDYELDQDPKEEFKIDPIAHLFEFLSSLKPQEQAWVQILIRTNKDKGSRKKGKWIEYESRWREDAKKMIKDIREKARMTYKDKEGKEVEGQPHPTPGQLDQIKAIERSIGKHGFDTGIRGIYMAEKDSFRAVCINGLTGVFKQFSSANLNGIVPTGWLADFNYPWQDWGGRRQAGARQGLVDAYRRRSWFHSPYKTPHYVMTTEELATIYRFPSSGIKAPGLRRTPATKSEPPPNLPM